MSLSGVAAVAFDVNGTLVEIRTEDDREDIFRAIGHFLTYQGIDLRLVRHVGDHGQGTGLGRRCRQLFGVDVGDDHLGAFRQEPLGGGPADALRAPRDDDNFPGKAHGYFLQ